MKILKWIRNALFIMRNQICLALSGNAVRYYGSCYISHKAKICHSGSGIISFGSNAVVKEGSLADAAGGIITIGSDFFLNRNSMIVSKECIRIGNRVSIGPNVCIYDHDHDSSNYGKFVTSPVTIGNDVWIGAGVIILRGSTIGDHAVIGAGAVIKQTVPASTVVYNAQSLKMRELTAEGAGE